jgi:hypothetical protein
VEDNTIPKISHPTHANENGRKTISVIDTCGELSNSLLYLKKNITLSQHSKIKMCNSLFLISPKNKSYSDPCLMQSSWDPERKKETNAYTGRST